MNKSYTVVGMTCGKCRAKVESVLAGHAPGVAVTLDPPSAVFTQSVNVALLNAALAKLGSYQLLDEPKGLQSLSAEPNKGWFATYQPILLITILISLASFAGTTGSGMVFHNWMINFMAGFFLVFAFFKLLDIRGFAEAYAGYDLIAMNWKPWGLIYPFIELALGFAYLFRFELTTANWVALVVMCVSILGVIRANLRKETIRCACLGTVLSLPMSTVTIIEDGLMIAMAAMMLAM